MIGGVVDCFKLVAGFPYEEAILCVRIGLKRRGVRCMVGGNE